MLHVLNFYRLHLIGVVFLLLPACAIPPSEDSTDNTSTKATKSANLIIQEVKVQADGADITSTGTGYDFGEQKIGLTKPAVITLFNTGDVAATAMTALSLSPPFLFVGTSYPGTGGTCSTTLGSQETCTVVVQFTPTEIAASEGTFQITYKNGKQKTVFKKLIIGKGISDPKISSVPLSYGPTTGNSTITIRGTHLFDGAVVTLGGLNCPATVLPPTMITCTTPARLAGIVDLVVTNKDGNSATVTNGYSFVAAPNVVSVSPNIGPLAGGSTITVTGTGFRAGLAVSLGGADCSTVTLVSSTTLTCVTPSHATGTVDLVVTNADFQASTGTGLYTYPPLPTISGVSPTAGALAGGGTLTITGTGFQSSATILVGSVACSSPTIAVTSITCTLPGQNAGAYAVSVTNPDTQSATLNPAYTYQPAPTITSLAPSRIFTSGRNVTFIGTGFVSGITATVNGNVCSSPVFIDSTSFTCIVGVNTVGTYTVAVANADSQSGSLSNAITVADNDVWKTTTTVSAASARMIHTTVWTGSQVLVWGGIDSTTAFSSGGAYDPVTDSWTALSNSSAPMARRFHSATWIGNKMAIFGGAYGYIPTDQKLYDPVANTWSTITNTNGPGPRNFHSAVWTGSKLIIWGAGVAGSPIMNEGKMYDPYTNTWADMTTTGAPSNRYSTASVWTGSMLIIWGGAVSSGNGSTGGQFDPYTNSWTEITTTGAPSARSAPGAIWTGSKMIVWGGGVNYPTGLNTGGVYDPFANSWTTVNTTGAPGARFRFATVWTGGKMLVFGGSTSTAFYNDSGFYDPNTNSWSLQTTNGAPTARVTSTNGDNIASMGVWTGANLVIFGGMDSSGVALGTGGVYIPPTDSASNTWTVMSTTGAPSPRFGSSTVWTGGKMIVFAGGDANNALYYNDGGIYDPVTDTWTPTSTTGAPSPRLGHIAVWTGSKMVVWAGGYPSPTFSGGRYDPLSNTWATLDTTGVNGNPFPYETIGVWTGSKVLIWGGSTPGGSSGTGGLYDPTNDSWTLTSTVGKPGNRISHVGLWTGGKFIVWGGSSPGYYNAGGIYDPSSNSWTLTTTNGAPAPRANLFAAWTGSKMIVFGGYDGTQSFNDGGIYDPFANSWTTLSTVNAPTLRNSGQGIWTGAKMIIWGSLIGNTSTNTGGLYDPIRDEWTVMTTTNAPLRRVSFNPLWTGRQMLVWSGLDYINNPGTLNTGGIYVP